MMRRGLKLKGKKYPSEILFDTGNGHGSGGTCIRLFTTITTVGRALTGANDATNGSSATVNENGTYAIEIFDTASGNATVGISINSADLTTSISSLSYGNGKRALATVSAGLANSCSITLKLKRGDIIRNQTDGGPNGSDGNTMMRITHLGP